MGITVEQFGKALVTAGLLTTDELKEAWAVVSSRVRPADGEAFAQALIQLQRITEFQAQEILSGGKTPLLLGDYVLLAKIGAGGMGQVFKAQHRKMKRLVAIKLLPTALTKDESATKRFQREVEAAAKLNHTNIVTAYDAGQWHDVHYLVMEYVDGIDLARIVKRDGPLPIDTALDYIYQTARGLAYAHAKGVIHRDIKPANILLDGEGTIKILDMGLARFEDSTSTDGLTGSEQVMGTIDYMSPEQAADTHNANARSDMYSLGCTLWYLLTGSRLYDGDTALSRTMKHREAPIPNLAKRREDVTFAIEQVFRKLVAKQPTDRYASMAEVVSTFEMLLGRSATTTRRGAESFTADPTLSAFLRNLDDKTATRVSAAPTTLKSAPADVDGVSSTEDFEEGKVETDPQSETSIGPIPPQQPLPRPQRRRASRTPWIATAVGGVLLLCGVVWVVIRNRDGQEVARVAVPPGGTVTVQPTPPTKPPVAKTATAAATVDLLKTIPDDLFRRFWVKNASGGITGECRTPGIDVPLPIPVTPPDEYDLDLTVARQGGALELQVGLAVGGVPCALVLQKPADGPAFAGLSLVAFNPADLPANPTHTPRPDWFTSEQPQSLRVEVRKQLVKVTADGKLLFEWQPKQGALSAPRDIRPPLPQGVLFVRAKSSKQPGRWDVQRLALTPRAGALKPVPLPPLYFERRAAEWAVSNGAKITIQAPEAQAQHVIAVSKLDALPDDPFYTIEINTGGVAENLFSAFSDAGMRNLLELDRLNTAVLDGKPFTSEGARVLATIPSLNTVDLSFSKAIDDEGGKALAALPKLVSLNLWGAPITDATCMALQDSSTIESLNLYSSGISRSGLACIARMPRLNRLVLGKPDAYAKGDDLVGLHQAKSLRTLLLSSGYDRSSFDALREALPDCHIRWRMQALSEIRFEGRFPRIGIREISTGALISHRDIQADSHYWLIELDFSGFKTQWDDAKCTSLLADMIELETLLFDDTAVTDESIPVLEKLINLKRLSLRGTGVTPEGLERLKKALPKCQVDGGPLPATPDKPADAK